MLYIEYFDIIIYQQKHRELFTCTVYINQFLHVTTWIIRCSNLMIKERKRERERERERNALLIFPILYNN